MWMPSPVCYRSARAIGGSDGPPTSPCRVEKLKGVFHFRGLRAPDPLALSFHGMPIEVLPVNQAEPGIVPLWFCFEASKKALYVLLFLAGPAAELFSVFGKVSADVF